MLAVNKMCIIHRETSKRLRNQKHRHNATPTRSHTLHAHTTHTYDNIIIVLDLITKII